jgi:hypothetical protein
MIKILSVHQPYANYILNGEKTLEIRTWKTKYRGKILICSTINKKFTPKINNYRFGEALCIAEIYDVVEFLPEHTKKSKIDFIKNHFAWCLKNITPIIKPFKIKGQQGLFNPPTYLKEELILLTEDTNLLV